MIPFGIFAFQLCGEFSLSEHPSKTCKNQSESTTLLYCSSLVLDLRQTRSSTHRYESLHRMMLSRFDSHRILHRIGGLDADHLPPAVRT